MPAHIDWTEVDDLAGVLVAAGVESVDVDPTRVRAPGVWISVRAIATEKLYGGPTYRLSLFCLAPDTDHRTARDLLAELHNTVAPVVDELGGTTGDVELVTLQIPGGATLPALRIPVDMDTDPLD